LVSAASGVRFAAAAGPDPAAHGVCGVSVSAASGVRFAATASGDAAVVCACFLVSIVSPFAESTGLV